MKNFFLWLLIVIALGLFALLSVPTLVDWNKYRGVFEEEISRFLSREVRVDGDVGLGFFPIPYVKFEKVRIADTPGIPGAFIKAEKFTLFLSLQQLLHGSIETRKLKIVRPVVRLRFDHKGRSNLQKIKFSAKNLPPELRVTLSKSTEIHKGRLILETRHGNEIGQITNITGKVTSRSFNNHLLFNGFASVVNAQLHVSSELTRDSKSGSFLFSLRAENQNTGAINYIDGHLSNFWSNLKFRGKYSARARVVAGDFISSKYDLYSDILLDHKTLKLSNIIFVFNRDGRLQKVKGNVRADWHNKVLISGKLASLWLDVDAMSIGNIDKAPHKVLESIINSITPHKFSNISGHIDIMVRQAKLGGEIINNLSVSLYQSGKKIRVERLSVNLPGRVKLRLSAQSSFYLGKPGWRGYALIKGDYFEDFSNWLWPRGLHSNKRKKDFFTLASKFAYSYGALEFLDTSINFEKHKASGSIHYNWREKKPKLALDWTSTMISLSSFGKNVLSNENLLYILGLAEQERRYKSINRFSEFLRFVDIDLRLSSDYVHDGNRKLKDVDIKFRRKADKLKFEKSKLTLTSGLSLQIEGDLVNLYTDQQGWELHGQLTADSLEATRELSTFCELVVENCSLPTHLHTFYPFNTVFSFHSGLTGHHRRNILNLNGEIRSHLVDLSILTSGELHQWLENDIQLDIRFDGKARHSGEISSAKGNTKVVSTTENITFKEKKIPYSMRLNVRGTPNKQLKTTTEVVSEAWHLVIQADSNKDAFHDTVIWNGSGNIQTGDAQSLLVNFFPSWKNLVPINTAVDGGFIFKNSQDKWILEPTDLKIAGSNISAELQLSLMGISESQSFVKGAVTIDRFDGSKIAQAFLSKNNSVPAPLRRSAEVFSNTDNFNSHIIRSNQKYWSDQSFDLSAVNWLDFDLKVSAASTSILPSLNLQNGQFRIIKKSKSLILQVLDGDIFGGRVTGNATFVNIYPSIKADVLFNINKMKTSSLISPYFKHDMNGHASVKLSATGQAANPHDLVKNLRGMGTAQFNNLQISGLGSESLTEIASSIVTGKYSEKDFIYLLDKSSLQKFVKFTDQRVKLDLSDGVLGIGEVVNNKKAPSVISRNVFDIVNMTIDSSWKVYIDPKLLPDKNIKFSTFPGLHVTYLGALLELNEAKPVINSESLLRVLKVMRAAHKVRCLELTYQNNPLSRLSNVECSSKGK